MSHIFSRKAFVKRRFIVYWGAKLEEDFFHGATV